MDDVSKHGEIPLGQKNLRIHISNDIQKIKKNILKYSIFRHFKSISKIINQI